jgi:WD40 repeat protein
MGDVLATISDEALCFWNREMREIGRMRISRGRFVAFTSDSLVLVADTARRYPCQVAGDPPVMRLGPAVPLDPRGAWNAASVTQDHQGTTGAVADGRRRRLLALAGADQTHATLFDLDAPLSAEPRRIGVHERLDQVALSPDGGWLATATSHGSGVKVWALDGDDPAPVAVLDYGRCRITFSQDGAWLAVATSNGYHFHRAGTWRKEFGIPCDLGVDIGWLAWSPRKTVIAIEPDDYMLAIHDCRFFSLQTSPQFEHQRPLNFSPDGSQLITTDRQHRIHLWDLALVREEIDRLGLDFKKLPYLPPSTARLVEGLVFESK